MLYKDQLDTSIKIPQIPKRIISLVPSQTELLVDLGLRDKLVGITKFCIHPKELRKELTVVGGTKNLHYSEIEKLSPDLIICNKEENTEEIVLKLKEIAPVWVSDIYSIEDSLQMVQSLGAICGVSKKAAIICSKIRSEKNAFLDFIKEKPKKKVAYVIWKKPFMIAGKNTFINTLLEINGFQNICEDKDSRYPEVDKDFLKEADEILLSTEPFPFKEKYAIKLEEEINVPTKIVDGEYFSWYGSRLINAFNYFKTLH